MLQGFVPEDRRLRRVAESGQGLQRQGSALFCDIVGFSGLSADLVRQHGRRGGAELLARVLDRVMGRIVRESRARGGFAVAFAGDGVTLWFDGAESGGAEAAALAAATVGLSLAAQTTDGVRLRLSMASGRFDRLTLGDPAFGKLDLLTGEGALELARMDSLAAAGRFVICAGTARLLGKRARRVALSGEGAFVLEAVEAGSAGAQVNLETLSEEAALDWVPLPLRAQVEALRAGTDLAALAEIRPVSALFILISGGGSEGAIDAFLWDLQAALHNAGGMLLELSADAKGIYAPCLFGAPVAHEDDPERALAAALAALSLGAAHGLALKIGVARGTGFAGLVAADSRLRYASFGTAMNRAARLMARAGVGTALVTDDLAERAAARFVLRQEEAVADGGGVWRLDAAREGAGPISDARHEVLVEREDLLARLDSALEGDGAALVVLDAPAGHGKTAVLARLRQAEEARGRLWLQGRPEEQLRDVPFHAWFAILRDLAGRAAELGLSGGEGELLRWLGGETREMPDTLAGMSGAERAVRIGAVVGSVLAALNVTEPVTLAFDDLHWADTRSLGLLLAVVSGGAPVRVVVARRTGPPSSMDGAMLLGHPLAQSFALDPLSDAGVLALAADRLGARTLSYDLERLLRDTAAGSPRFVRLIAEVLQARRLVQVVDGHCSVVAEAEHLGRLDFIESEEAAILARFDALDEAQRDAVRLASLLGRTFTQDELEAALGDKARVAAAIAALLASGHVAQRRGQGGLQFVQPVEQQALAQAVAFARRAPVHRRLAAFWDGRAEPEALARRARHLLRALDVAEQDPVVIAEAIAALERAAHQAAEASANLEASDLLQAAVDLSNRMPDSPETLRQRLHLQAGLAFGLATFRGYGDPSVEAAYSAALALADEAENSADLAFTIYGVFSFYASRGDYAKAMPIARRLHRLAQQFRDLRLASIAHQSRGILAILRGRVANGARLAARSIDAADQIGSGLFFPHGGAGDFRIFSGTWQALALALSGQGTAAAEVHARAFALSETNPFARAFLRSFCPLPALDGDGQATLVEADAIVADAEMRGLPLFSVIGGILSGWAAAVQGLDDARVGRFLNANIHIAQAMGLGSFTPWYLVLAVEAHLARGDLASAGQALGAAEAAITRSGRSAFAPEVLRARGRVAEAQGARDLARGLFEQAAVAARATGLVTFRRRAEADGARLDETAARAVWADSDARTEEGAAF